MSKEDLTLEHLLLELHVPGCLVQSTLTHSHTFRCCQLLLHPAPIDIFHCLGMYAPGLEHPDVPNWCWNSHSPLIPENGVSDHCLQPCQLSWSMALGKCPKCTLDGSSRANSLMHQLHRWLQLHARLLQNRPPVVPGAPVFQPPLAPQLTDVSCPQVEKSCHVTQRGSSDSLDCPPPVHSQLLPQITVGSIPWSHPFALTNSPKLSGAFPDCLDRSTRMVFTDSRQVISLWSVNFPLSSWHFQRLFSRCRELHSAHWHFQQLFSSQKNHGRCIASICLTKSLQGTLQMSRMAVVPAVLSPVSFLTPALSSTITTLLSSSVFSMAPAIPSSHTTILTSSRVLFPSSRTTSDWLLTSSIHTRTQRTAAESWRRHFWGAFLLGNLPCWVTLTTAGDSRHTLLLSPLDRLRERLLRDLTHGTRLLLTGDLLGDLAFLGDVPRQPVNHTLGSLHRALPGDVLMRPPLGDIPLQPAASLWPVSLLAGLPTDGKALLPRCLFCPRCRDRSARLTAPLLSPWKITPTPPRTWSIVAPHLMTTKTQTKQCVVLATSSIC